MRRFFGAIGFAIVGLVSVVVWAAIDTRLCSAFDRLCTPHPGECGGGVDACATTLHSTISLLAYLFGPPIIFGAIGFVLFARRRTPAAIAGYLAIAIAAQWLLTFVGVRVLHI
ncbi:hypothetical protein [Burkholderia catarinensis]|uniref:hypothetical protein n=1 Tax=Burkholderia catarinensis TaxID=1108140 RepID=UPI000922F5BF|nr:hypothetical protein [Burkholderia catarinensis]KAG8154333.1 hypothetical protein BFF94_006020 [Burkholderia catarinensis]